MTHYLFYFLTFSFLGWVLEVAYSAVRRGRFVNRGFVFGPACPIYGVCAMLLRLCLSPLSDYWLILFLAAFALATVVELATGFVMDKIFATKWWDYSAHRCNICGYVCLRFSVYWGLLGAALVKFLFPVWDFVFSLLPLLVWQIVLWGFFALLMVDVALSVAGAFHLKVQLRLLRETRRALTKGSDTIGKGVYLGTAMLEEKYHQLAKKSVALYHRFLDAFPTMRTRDGVEIGVLRELLARGRDKLFGQRLQDTQEGTFETPAERALLQEDDAQGEIETPNSQEDASSEESACLPNMEKEEKR